MTNSIEKNYISISLIILFIFYMKVSKSQNTESVILRSIHIIDSPIYWMKVKPLNFIDTLRKYPNDKFLILYIPPHNWYDVKLISYLEYKINDSTKSGFAVSGLDSYYYEDIQSTVGEQVQCLIQGIKDKMYPPTYWLMNRRLNSKDSIQ